MGQFMFGAGSMYCIPKVAVPTPRLLGTMQEVSIDFSGNIKELFGQNQFAEATARGQQKVTGKAKFAKIKIDTYNDLYFNEAVLTGQNLVALNEIQVVKADDHTVKVKQAGFLTDLGVSDATTGKIFKRVADVPASGEYSLNVATGTYALNTDMDNKTVYVSYMYHDALTGKTIVINNQPMGEAPSFMGIFNGRFAGNQMTLILNTCVSSKLSLVSTKLEDFNIPEFDFSASVNEVGSLGTLSATE